LLISSFGVCLDGDVLSLTFSSLDTDSEVSNLLTCLRLFLAVLEDFSRNCSVDLDLFLPVCFFWTTISEVLELEDSGLGLVLPVCLLVCLFGLTISFEEVL